MPDQTPAKRLIAKACRPMSRMSCTLDGKNTGRPQALKMWSLWCARGRALGDVVVAGERDHAAVLRGAGHVGVLEDVGAAVDARALAVPDAEHAVELLRLAGRGRAAACPRPRWRASSSLTPGWNTMCCAARCFFAAHSAWS